MTWYLWTGVILLVFAILVFLLVKIEQRRRKISL